jgi:DNA-binding transcriptional regulator YiaG
MADVFPLHMTRDQVARAQLLSDMENASGGIRTFAPVVVVVEGAPAERAALQTAYRPVCRSFGKSAQAASGSFTTYCTFLLMRQLDEMVDKFATVDFHKTAANYAAEWPISPSQAIETIQSTLSITRNEIAKLIGVTRQTLHAWTIGTDVRLRKASSFDALMKLGGIAEQWKELAGSNVPVPRWSLQKSEVGEGMLKVLKTAVQSDVDPSVAFTKLLSSMHFSSQLAKERGNLTTHKLPRRTRLQVLAESFNRYGSGNEKS